MLARLFFIFTTATLVEVFVLVQLGRWMGLLPTLALIIVTGFLGAVMARNQGSMVLERVRTDLEAGRIPTEPAMDGLFILLAGAFLMTPGALTDLVGFALLIPPVRIPLKRWLRRRARQWIAEGRLRVRGPTGIGNPHDPASGPIIDLPVERSDDDLSERGQP